MKLYKIYFKALKQFKKADVQYLIYSEDMNSAVEEAEKVMEKQGLNRKWFWKNWTGSEQKIIRRKPPKVQDEDPFDQIAPKIEWTIDTLNERLAQLKSGERFRVEGLTQEIYRGVEGLHCSDVKLFLNCEQKFESSVVKHEGNSFTKAQQVKFDFGTAGHTMLLEPHKFKYEYIMRPDNIPVRKGEVWNTFNEQVLKEKNLVELPRQDYLNMDYLFNKFVKTDLYQNHFKHGIAESSYFYRDPETGFILKARPDMKEGDQLWDVKFSGVKGVNFVKRNAKDLGYPIQDVMYCEVCGVNPPMKFLFVDDKVPFVMTDDVSCAMSTRNKAYLEYRAALRRIKALAEADEPYYKPYTTDAVVIGLNQYEWAEYEQLQTEAGLDLDDSHYIGEIKQ